MKLIRYIIGSFFELMIIALLATGIWNSFKGELAFLPSYLPF